MVEKNAINKVKAAEEANPEVLEIVRMLSLDGSFHFYRKDIVGDWRTHFTVLQNKQFNKVFGEKLKDTVFGYN